MKNAIILHGTGSSPESFWLPSIKAFLEKKGYSVWVPALPDADEPELSKWLPFVLKKGKFSGETILVSHSAGGPLLLSVLENSKVKVRKAILVAGYARGKGGKKYPEKILQKKYDWKKIKSHVKEIVFINSDNDPWGCDHIEGHYMHENLEGTLIILEGEGHMGSDKFRQPYKKFPLLEKLLSSE
ncbi:MAG: alpha/beta hydrolase [Candidatus Diapherotrites archaeon]